MQTSSTVEVQILHAFVDGDRGGNPAGVVLDADALTPAQKQAVARQTGLSETAFVSRSATADFKLDFFTPTRQIAHCGHATIAAFSLLAQLGVIRGPHSSKETIEGRREIRIAGELAFMEQKAPHYQEVEASREPILRSVGLTGRDLLPGAPVLKVNTGNSFVIIPVASPETLSRVGPAFDAIAALSEKYDLIGYYVFSPLSPSTGRDAATRMFAPRYGIPEEAATGMAAGPLACYLYDQLQIRKEQFLIEQGRYMTPPSPSVIQVKLSLQDHRITGLMAGGKGVRAGKVHIPL
jgi:PhzF family phenazine biosynthesis protein